MHTKGKIAYQVPILPMRYARHFARFMEGHGIHKVAFLEGTRITEERLNEADGFLSMTEILSVLQKSQELLDDELAPFKFGQSLDLIKHGLLGHALLCQDDVKMLLTTNIQYLRICLPLMDIKLKQSGEKFIISLGDSWDLGPLRTFIMKMYLGSIYTMTSLICRQFSFKFNFSTKLPEKEWSELIKNSQLEFNAEESVVSMELVGRQQAARNDDNIADHLAMANSKQKLEYEGTLNVLLKVRQKITNTPGRDSTLERVAQQLGMCARSVRRHLKLAGFSFQDIRNEVRETFATRYLTDTNIPLEKIAERLGYSDQASFTKAYRGWTGKTPGTVRKSHSPSC
ncbi:MAG: helix-turn-helix domain-containing protein [Alcanivoracaceae bacterium]|nr:helix-turn-helix domain-containing protein [Alcanivoracaceae bacterium]